MAFRDGIKQIEAYCFATELNVLVWGPGESSPEDYNKRLKILQSIQKQFTKADVRLSEDEHLRQLVPDPGAPLHQQELWHLGACDVCVVLDTSKGPGEEIAHFIGSRFKRKLLILTHEKHKEARSFPASLRQTENQVFFTDEEYSSCSLVEQVINRVKTVALGRIAGMTAI